MEVVEEVGWVFWVVVLAVGEPDAATSSVRTYLPKEEV